MRTTLTLDDDLAALLKQVAYDSGRPFKQVVDEALRAGLVAGGHRPRPRPYRVEPASLGGVRPGIDLDKVLRLSDELEDRAIARKLQERR